MKFRRHTASPALTERRIKRIVTNGIWIVAAAVIGYLATVIWLFPAPVVSADRPTPRVLELPRAEALNALIEVGLRGRIIETEDHPTLPSGTIIWQDPPPGVVLPEGAVVRLTVSSGACWNSGGAGARAVTRIAPAPAAASIFTRSAIVTASPP